jgi:hypothetical protein
MLSTLPNFTLVEGFPDNLYDRVDGHDNSLIVLDDLISQCSNDERVSNLFTRGSHHRGISVLFLTQNLFPPDKLSRTISLNTKQVKLQRSITFLFTTFRLYFSHHQDKLVYPDEYSLGITKLARQMFPKHTSYLMESFEDATSKPYGYLMIDCHQLSPENMRLRTNILPGERQIVYVKRT